MAVTESFWHERILHSIKVLNVLYVFALVIVSHYTLRPLLYGGRSVRLLYYNSIIYPGISRSSVHEFIAAGTAFLS